MLRFVALTQPICITKEPKANGAYVHETDHESKWL